MVESTTTTTVASVSVGSLVPLPSPIATAKFPTCANNCAEITRAYVSCAQKFGYAVNDCFCTILSWPTACEGFCSSSDDLTSLAAWYWDVCPYEMDRKLGQIGISRWLSHGPTAQGWVIATSPNVAELRTGYDCYYSSQFCLPTSTAYVMPSTSTDAITSPTATVLVEPVTANRSTAPSATTVVLGVFIPLLLIAIGLMIFLLIRRKRRRRQPETPPPYSERPHDALTIRIENLIINCNSRDGDAADIVQQILARLDVLHQAAGNGAAPQDAPMENRGSFQAALKELLTCAICFEIFHRPVSAINAATHRGGGCLHTFCGACAVRLVRGGRRPVQCPEDRNILTSFNDHRLLSQICEEFLNRFPDERRSADDIAAMDELYTVGTRIL